MALQTKTITAACDHGYTLELRLTENGTDAVNNTSSVSWSLVLRSGSCSFSDYRIGWSVSLAGAVVSSQAWATAAYRSIAKNSELAIKSGAASVAHGADGSLNMAAAFSITMSRSSYAPVNGSSGEGTVNGAGTMALTTIPRASALTAANGVLGTAQTLTIARCDSAFTHTLTYACGSLTGQTAGLSASTGIGTSVTFTPPLALARQNTAGAAVDVTFTLTTKNGGAAVGTVTKTVTMTIPASVKPSCAASVEAVSDNATVSGWGVAVKGYSRYRVTTAFTGAQGSTLAARTVKIAATGQTLTASPADSAPLASTDRTVRVQVQDSRGRRSAELTVTGPAIYDYGAPTISAAEASRCDSGGAASDSGAYLRVRCSGGVSPCGGHNAKTIQYRRRASGGSWTAWAALTDGAAAVVDAGLGVGSSCRVQFRITDSLGGSRTVTVTVPTASVAMNLRAGGRGAAFGKYAEADDTVDFGAWHPVGYVLGLGKAGSRLQNADFNDILTPGVYAITSNDDAAAMTHCPSALAGTLRVWQATGKEEIGGRYHYLLQEYVDYQAHVYLRSVSSGGTAGVYTCDPWKQVAMT